MGTIRQEKKVRSLTPLSQSKVPRYLRALVLPPSDEPGISNLSFGTDFKLQKNTLKKKKIQIHPHISLYLVNLR